MKEITILEILFVSFLLLSPIVAGYFGLRMLRLTKRNKHLQKDRDAALKEWYKVQREKPHLDVFEKKMILTALGASQYKAVMEDPKTKHEVRKIYRELKEKLKVSIDV